MSGYRKNARGSELLGEYHASVVAPALAIFGCAVASVFFIHHAITDGSPGARTMTMAFLAPLGTVMAVRKCRRLQRTSLRLYEGGMELDDGRRAQHIVAWEDVIALEAQYVPGRRGDGPDNADNLVALIVTHRGGRVSVPTELQGFAMILDEVRARTPAPYREAILASVAERD